MAGAAPHGQARLPFLDSQPKGRNEFVVVVVIPTAAPAGEATLDPSKHLNNQAARTRHRSKRRYCITIMPHLDLSAGGAALTAVVHQMPD
jgi:hypothetical protein